MKINRISPLNHNYLQIIASIANPPDKLHFMGTLPTERRPTVAIVGTRRPSSYGREVTSTLASDLARRGVVIVSGLALGVDGIAHTAALEVGGTTLAVLGNGLPRIYPASHQHLATQIIESGGALLSEYEPGVTPRDYRFLERNRIVAGLADAIIITEAAARSGTLNTAAHALEQGKEVFVVPGNITSPLSAGCNALLRQGATPATCADDILAVIAPELLNSNAHMALGATPLEAKIIDIIRAGLRDGDAIKAQLGITQSEFNTTLTMMELSGTIRSLGGNQWGLR